MRFNWWLAKKMDLPRLRLVFKPQEFATGLQIHLQGYLVNSPRPYLESQLHMIIGNFPPISYHFGLK